MFQPDFFTSQVHPLKVITVEGNGSVSQFEIQVSELDISRNESLARDSITGNTKFWYDGAKYNTVFIFPN